jgi:hypothetical protein
MRWKAAALVLALAGIVGAPAVLASGSYDLSWWSVDGGGHTFSTGEGYALGGTIGQPDAGELTGDGYALGGGFWRGGALAERYRLYLPLTLRAD